MDRRAVVWLRLFLALVCAALSAATLACQTTEGVEVVFYVDNGHSFSDAEKIAIEAIARGTVAEVRQLLPGLPASIVLRVHAGTDVIPEVGATAEVSPPNVVYWTVDVSRPEGVSSIVQRHLRATLFHEFHHLVRGEAQSLMEHIVAEGLATVFERDYADAEPPWGNYPRNVTDWLPEIEALPPDAPRGIWMTRHPDGRRWVGYKVGTYVVDEAVRRSRRSVVDITALPAEEILRLARQP